MARPSLVAGLIIGAAFMASACAPTQRWEHAARSPEQRSADIRACQGARDAELSRDFARIRVKYRYTGPHRDEYQRGQDQEEAIAHALGRCMMARGYTQVGGR